MLYAPGVLVTVKWQRVFVRLIDDVACKATRDLVCRNAFFRRAVNFDPITSREHERFRATRYPQNAIGLSVAGKALARLHVCGEVGHACTENIHDNGWLWLWKLM